MHNILINNGNNGRGELLTNGWQVFQCIDWYVKFFQSKHPPFTLTSHILWTRTTCNKVFFLVWNLPKNKYAKKENNHTTRMYNTSKFCPHSHDTIVKCGFENNSHALHILYDCSCITCIIHWVNKCTAQLDTKRKRKVEKKNKTKFPIHFFIYAFWCVVCIPSVHMWHHFYGGQSVTYICSIPYTLL